jgi:hypothetical protein
MSLITHGEFEKVFKERYVIQVDRTVTEKVEGTLEGTIKFKAKKEDADTLPTFGDLHVDDNRMELFNREVVYNGLDVVTMTASYFGLAESSPTGGPGQVVSFSGGANNEPIETHPDFDRFAGTAFPPAAREEGSVWDPVTGQFLRFDGGQFKGVQYYLTPSTQITVSYWKDSVPILKPRMKIVEKISGVSLPSDVVNLLRVESSYRQTGSSYQVTEVYLASGDKGWDKDIYPD